MNLSRAQIITAMVTPFNEQGAVDYDRLTKLIDFLVKNHTEGIVVGGTTGEVPTLSHDEKLELYRKTVEIANGRLAIVAGVGSNNTYESAEFIKEVAKIEGIEAGLAVVPYYNKPNQEGLYRHFTTIAEASELPIILYNVPGRTITSLDLPTTLRLAKHPNIIGVKECAGLDRITELLAQVDEGFYVFTGEDSLAFAAKALGAKGVISVASHVLGNVLYEMYQAIDQANMPKAAKLQQEFLPKANALFSVPSPAPVKMVLNELNVKVGGVRLPLVECTEEEKQQILKKINLL